MLCAKLVGRNLQKFCEKNSIEVDKPIPTNNVSKSTKEDQQTIKDYINSNTSIKEKIINLYTDDWEWYNKFKKSRSNL